MGRPSWPRSWRALEAGAGGGAPDHGSAPGGIPAREVLLGHLGALVPDRAGQLARARAHLLELLQPQVSARPGRASRWASRTGGEGRGEEGAPLAPRRALVPGRRGAPSLWALGKATRPPLTSRVRTRAGCSGGVLGLWLMGWGVLSKGTDLRIKRVHPPPLQSASFAGKPRGFALRSSGELLSAGLNWV